MTNPPKPAKSHGRLSQSASLTPRELITDTPRLAKAWCAKVITLCPQVCPGVLGASLTGKALQQGLWALETVDLRTFGIGSSQSPSSARVPNGSSTLDRSPLDFRSRISST